MNEYYEVNDGWFTYYVNVVTGDKKFELSENDIIVSHNIDTQMHKLIVDTN